MKRLASLAEWAVSIALATGIFSLTWLVSPIATVVACAVLGLAFGARQGHLQKVRQQPSGSTS